MEQRFVEIIQLIKESQSKAIKAVNTELMNLYWRIGKYISARIETSEWGQSVVKELAFFIKQHEPELKGFSDKNLWRMKQFYETYRSSERLSSLTRELSWTNNVLIFSRTKTVEEKEFYLKLTIEEKYSSRELERQINSSVFERTMIGNVKLSSLPREFEVDINKAFKDSYVFDFLNLPESYNEGDLQKGLLRQMKDFILELGRDFLFIDQEYKVQVGNSDFYIDLLFFHRGLQCLVAFELKVDKFKPEHLGQLNFYLEALDRDVKRSNENASIGVLLCKDKDSEVVEYALSRSLSPTVVAEYKTQLPDKKLLQQKLHELFEQADNSDI
ncbi:PDDEXK nuclease domain-containing protein [Sphingobacterium siyangense]|uniref:PDDEXK nuclease domain-containing protein n=1 Tax=Sphingobacterium siyangense TaxID=459529 RepID=UPI003C72032E